jgi:hypothetical protein
MSELPSDEPSIATAGAARTAELARGGTDPVAERRRAFDRDDHERNVGGGTLDLVPGVTKNDRLQWLHDRRLISNAPIGACKSTNGGTTVPTDVATHGYPDESGTQGRDGWNDPGWAQAARDYHAARAGRLGVVEIEPERLARLRLLLSDNISLDRVWHELNDPSTRPAPQTTVNALLYQLRKDGLAALENPNCRRRLADISDEQLHEVLAALIRARARYAAVTDELLITLDEIRCR